MSVLRTARGLVNLTYLVRQSDVSPLRISFLDPSRSDPPVPDLSSHFPWLASRKVSRMVPRSVTFIHFESHHYTPNKMDNSFDLKALRCTRSRPFTVSTLTFGPGWLRSRWPWSTSSTMIPKPSVRREQSSVGSWALFVPVPDPFPRTPCHPPPLETGSRRSERDSGLRGPLRGQCVPTDLS